MFTLVSSSPVKKIYTGYGYQITVRRMFDDFPVTISISPIGLDKLFKPGFTVFNKKLSVDYSSMSSVVFDHKQEYFPWTKDVSDFIDAFFDEYDDLIKF